MPRLQRWMGPPFTRFVLETYGHLIDGDLRPALDSHGTAIDREDRRAAAGEVTPYSRDGRSA
jgi:hypothetical protein